MPSLSASAKPRSAAFSVWRRGHVDGRVGERACLRPVEHLGVDLGGCDGHGSPCGVAGRTRPLDPAPDGTVDGATSGYPGPLATGGPTGGHCPHPRPNDGDDRAFCAKITQTSRPRICERTEAPCRRRAGPHLATIVAGEIAERDSISERLPNLDRRDQQVLHDLAARCAARFRRRGPPATRRRAGGSDQAGNLLVASVDAFTVLCLTAEPTKSDEAKSFLDRADASLPDGARGIFRTGLENARPGRGPAQNRGGVERARQGAPGHPPPAPARHPPVPTTWCAGQIASIAHKFDEQVPHGTLWCEGAPGYPGSPVPAAGQPWAAAGRGRQAVRPVAAGPTFGRCQVIFRGPASRPIAPGCAMLARAETRPTLEGNGIHHAAHHLGDLLLTAAGRSATGSDDKALPRETAHDLQVREDIAAACLLRCRNVLAVFSSPLSPNNLPQRTGRQGPRCFCSLHCGQGAAAFTAERILMHEPARWITESSVRPEQPQPFRMPTPGPGIRATLLSFGCCVPISIPLGIADWPSGCARAGLTPCAKPELPDRPLTHWGLSLSAFSFVVPTVLLVIWIWSMMK